MLGQCQHANNSNNYPNLAQRLLAIWVLLQLQLYVYSFCPNRDNKHNNNDLRSLMCKAVEQIPTLCHELRNFQTVSVFFSALHEVWILSGEKGESQKELTTFIMGLLRFYEFNRLSLGLSHAPTTYQRIMEECPVNFHPTAGGYGHILVKTDYYTSQVCTGIFS